MVAKQHISSEVSYWIIRIGAFLMSVTIMVSSWFLNQAWTRIDNIDKSVHALEIATAGASGSKFTSTNWIDAKSLLDNERLAMDRRLIRLEESLPVIRESLVEIKDMAKDRHNNPPQTKTINNNDK